MDPKSNFHINAIKSEIRRCIIDRKANACPMAIRLAWHASGTYSKNDKTGGNNGATMRFEPESADGANAGLSIMRDILKPVKDAFPEESIADIWALAGAAVVEFCGGPEIEVKLGRTDAASGASCPVVGRLPDAAQGAQHLRDVFHRMGFNDQEIVALSGAHTMGSCHKTRSGFDGPWTRHPLQFDNQYFKNLVELTWQPRTWDGPLQYEDKETGELMMLPTDLALTTDPAFAPFVRQYAADAAAFKTAFKAAYENLLSLGCPAQCQPGGAYEPGAAGKAALASRYLREHCMHGSLERATAQLRDGADPHALELDSGRSALHKAAFWGHAHIVPWLLSLNCDPNVQDAYGDTPLHDAARFGHAGCVDALVQGGADISLKNVKGQTAAEVALAYGKTLPPSLSGILATGWQSGLSKGVLTLVCAFMACAVDMPVLFGGQPAWESSFAPTKRLPTGLSPRERAIARAGVMFDHGFQLPLFVLVLLCVHLGPPALRKLANLVLLVAICLNGPYGIPAWLGPLGYDPAVLDSEVMADTVLCGVLGLTLAISLTE